MYAYFKKLSLPQQMLILVCCSMFIIFMHDSLHNIYNSYNNDKGNNRSKYFNINNEIGFKNIIKDTNIDKINLIFSIIYETSIIQEKYEKIKQG